MEPESEQGPANTPVLLVDRVTEPVGVMKVPGEESVTVTLQVPAVLMLTVESHVMLIVVERLLMVILVVASGFEAAWFASPA